MIGQQTTSHAPGQHLGYSLQTTRFLMRLLDADDDWTVSLEVFEDVGVETSKGQRIAEQGKSATENNPVSDRARDLWKTFSNWIDAVNAGQLLPETTFFELYISHPRTGGIVESFSSAKSYDESLLAFLNARTKLWGPSPEHTLKSTVSETIQPYVENVFDADSDMVCKIIQNFNFEHGSGSPQEDLEIRFSKGFVPADIVSDVVLYAQGWVKKETDCLLEQKKPACISVQSFRQAITSFIRKHDNRTILNTFAGIPSREEIQQELQIKTYVRQLDIIDADYEQKIRAVTDFLKASVDRTEWSVQALVHESSFDEFEDSLLRTWDNKKRKADIILAGNSDTQKGQHLYLDCSSHQATLEGLVVPSHFTPGGFHALADDQVIGWHPKYKDELNIAGDERNP